MMEKFRNLSKNIFFKIFLGFLALSFVMFGVSSFILNNNNGWVAKIGDKTISYSQFLKNLQSERSVIYKSFANQKNQEQVAKYLESENFRNDVLGKIITRNLVTKVGQDLGIYADQDIILKQILVSTALKGKDGKFDRELYKNFLASNNLTEKEHLDEVASEVVGNIIVQSFLQVGTYNSKLAEELVKHREEKRVVDIINISLKNIPAIKAPNDFDLNDYFEKNKSAFVLPETRRISYISFKQKDLPVSNNVSQKEIEDEYQANLNDYKIPESRDFYHLIFKKRDEADRFYDALKKAAKNANSNLGKDFVKLAFDLQKKSLKDLLFSKVHKEDLIKEVADQAFGVQKNQFSEVIESPLGFHVFYLINSKPESITPLAEVQDKIKTKILNDKKENGLNDVLTQIDDYLITSNSLEKTVRNFKLKTPINRVSFDATGFDSKQKKIAESSFLEGFVENSFGLKKQQTSKLLFSAQNQQYYAIFVDEINESRPRSLDEVKPIVEDLIIKERKQEKLRELAQNVAKEARDSGANFASIAAKHGLKLESNRTFQRFYMVDSAGNKKTPYANKFVNEVFDLRIRETSNPIKISSDEFAVIALKAINQPNTENNKSKIANLEKEMDRDFKIDNIASYNKYVQSKFPVEVNQQVLSAKKQDDQ